jgi:hypothetical protein
MSTSKHTPGPWTLDVEAGTVQGCREIVGQDGGIASTHGLDDDEEDLANARILAAALDMLEAGSDVIVRAITGEAPSGFALVPNEAFARLRAAIAKATGSES